MRRIRERLFAMGALSGFGGLIIFARYLGFDGDVTTALLALAMLLGSYYFRPRGVNDE